MAPGTSRLRKGQLVDKGRNRENEPFFQDGIDKSTTNAKVELRESGSNALHY